MRPKSISQKQIQQFQKEIWQYYARNKRDFPWRRPEHYGDPYKILVSELMLQQTQASWVVGKYQEFIEKFPTFETLDRASVAEVIAVWRGLGYNRRALALKKIAALAGEKWHYTLPKLSVEELDALPHIGYATACSISAFAWNVRVSFIETNIRRVFIHRFFKGQTKVSDMDILALVERMLPESDRGRVQNTSRSGPREWYYALMDYGSMLKGVVENPNRQGKGYKRQSAFVGSNRQVRGAILAVLARPEYVNGCTKKVLLNGVRKNILTPKSPKTLKVTQRDIDTNITTLAQEGFLHILGATVSLAKK
ncbi:MAG: A/G-specific adenine glycosylase [Patescibacteria group bacterium]